MADHEDPDYNNTHRAFLQAFIARSILTFEEAKLILAAIFGARGTALPSVDWLRRRYLMLHRESRVFGGRYHRSRLPQLRDGHQ